MAKFKPMELIQSTWGKICEHSDYSFVRGRKNQYTQKICNPSTKDPSTLQTWARNIFKTTSQAIKAILDDSAQKATALAAFKAQSKYDNLHDYLYAQEYAKAVAANPKPQA